MKELHRLTNINETDRTGSCSICGFVRIKLRDSRRKNLTDKYRCNTVYKLKINRTRYPHRLYKKDCCELCGFKAEHTVQLDVDHIDGDNKNNDPINLQTLCANCHRLKTLLNKDGAYRQSL